MFGSFIRETIWTLLHNISLHELICNMIICYSQNYLTEFPTNLEPLIGKLFELNLSYNKISEDLPGTILEKGIHLQYLNLSSNQLSKIPSEISKLTNLREICLSFNKFQSIPTSLQACEKLETLLINDNQIQEIDVEGLRKLKSISGLPERLSIFLYFQE